MNIEHCDFEGSEKAPILLNIRFLRYYYLDINKAFELLRSKTQ